MSRQIDVVVQAVVGTNPALGHTSNNKDFCRFRVAVTPSHREADGWVDDETMWMTAKAWGQLARNLAFSLHKGEPVLLAGRLSEDKWSLDGVERRGNVLTIQSAGHDLSRGESRFSRTIGKTTTEAENQADLAGAENSAGPETTKGEAAALADDHWENKDIAEEGESTQLSAEAQSVQDGEPLTPAKQDPLTEPGEAAAPYEVVTD